MEKIKQFIESEKGKDIFIVLIVILVGIGSFELGRLSKVNQAAGIKIEYPDKGEDLAGNIVSASEFTDNFSQNIPPTNAKISQAISSSNSPQKNYFASNRGTKYYSLGCSAGKSLKLENRVYFTTSAEAEKAGYKLSSSCR